MSLNINNYEVNVISNGYNKYLHHETFSAVVFLDGQPTTRSCMHSHRSLRTALRCIRTLTEQWEQIIRAAEVTEIEPNLFSITSERDLGITGDPSFEGTRRLVTARYKMVEATDE
jgi:hypothetical protein